VRSPWAFVPTLYFAEGLPYVLINSVSVILYKRMGLSNARIAFWTSFLYLPWVLKMFWGPLVDLRWTRRRWVVSTQLFMACCLFLIAASLLGPGFLPLSLLAFTVGAFVSATHDIAVDGFYMMSLGPQDQAFFSGIRSTFYRLAMIFGSGALVYLAGRLEAFTGQTALSWAAVLAVSGATFLGLGLYHWKMLPYPAADLEGSSGRRELLAGFGEVLRSYFAKDDIKVMLAFILLYRFAEALLLKMAAPFLLDSLEAGGMGLSTSQVGIVYGTTGLLALVLGGVLGGWLISRYGFRKCLWPMVFCLHLPDLAYAYMAWAHPPLLVVAGLVALEQLGYGVGYAAFTVYLLYTAEGRYQTSHYAVSTGIMALGMMLPGFISGALQQATGYKTFFLIVVLMTIPSTLPVFFIRRETLTGAS